MSIKKLAAAVCALSIVCSSMSNVALQVSAETEHDIQVTADEVKSVATLDELNAALSGGGNYEVGADIGVNNTGIRGNTVIDGAGHTLTCINFDNNAMIYQNDAVETEFKNVVFKGCAKGDVGIWEGNGSITITDSTIENFAVNSGRCAAVALGGGRLTLNNVKFKDNSQYDICIAGSGEVNIGTTTELAKMRLQSNTCTLNIGTDWQGSFEITIDSPEARMLGTVAEGADISNITVTNEGFYLENKNGLLNIVQEAGSGEDDFIPTLTVDMTDEKHPILHGSAGFLYGISNEGVPNVNTITPLKPKVLATKGALGTEHPYGDALDVAEEFFEAGGEQVMMYNSNYYGVIGVTATAEDYAEVLRTIIAPYVAEWKDNMREKYPDIDERIIYIPINEGTPIQLASGEYNFNEAWKLYYEAIIEGEREYYEKNGKYPQETYEKTAYLAGPNEAIARNYAWMEELIDFCNENDCMPDIVTWHELNVANLNTLARSAAEYRDICEKRGLEPKQVVINEYADEADCGVPGRLVNWIARLEDAELYGCLPFWHQANNLNDLAADDNSGNGAWWAFKWYGDMSGMTLNVKSNTWFAQLYGCATIDDTKKIANVLAGGVDGNAKIVLDNIDETKTFKNAEKVHIKVEAAYFSAYHGAVYEPAVVSEGTYAVKDGKVEVELSDMLFSTAYNLTITEATDEVSLPMYGAWRAVYEAEDAELLGNAAIEHIGDLGIPPYYLSAEYRVRNLNSEGNGVRYTVDVPIDGNYKLEFLYANGVGLDRGNVNHAPKNLSMSITIDDGDEETLLLPNTLFFSMEGVAEKYVDLTAGTHTITLMCDGKEKEYYPGENIDPQLYQDAMYVTYSGSKGAERKINKTYEAETADFNKLGDTEVTNVNTQSTANGYSGSGYVKGLNESPVENGGGIRWIVAVEKSGTYNLRFRYMTSENGNLRIYKDNTNLTFTNLLTSVPIADTGNIWANVSVPVYLMKGINLIDIDTDIDAAVDYMQVTETDTESIIVEAESGTGNFETAYSPYANATYVKEIVADPDEDSREENGRYLEFKVSVPEAGKYNMQTFISNDDMCGTHVYNIKIIDRYACVSVNGKEGVRYFFANTFSDDTFREKTIPVELNEGENTIRLYNDDSWEVYYGGSRSEPGTDRLENYMPNFDKFVFTKAVSDNDDSVLPQYTAEIKTTRGGFVTVDKAWITEGKSAEFTISPEKSVIGTPSKLEHFYVNGVETEVADNNDGTYTYVMENVTDNITVTAVFSIPIWLEELIEEAEKRLSVKYCYASPTTDTLKKELDNAKVVYDGTDDETKLYNAYLSFANAYESLLVKQTEVSTDDMVGFWRFDNNLISNETGAELTVVNSDLSAGGEEKYVPYSFSGYGADFDQSYALKIGTVGKEFTVSAWVKTESTGLNMSIFFKNMGTAVDAEQKWVCVCNEGSRLPKIWAHDTQDFLWRNVIKHKTATVGVWTHYAYTEKDGRGTLYINGEKVGSGFVPTADSADLYFGATYWSDHRLKGSADNLFLSNKQMNDYEISALYSGQLPPDSSINTNELINSIIDASFIDRTEMSESKSELIDTAMAIAADVIKNNYSSQEEIDKATAQLKNAVNATEDIEWTEIDTIGQYKNIATVKAAYAGDFVYVRIVGADTVRAYSALYAADGKMLKVECIKGAMMDNDYVFSAQVSERQRIFIWDNEMSPLTESID